jgi:hypothetical protein
MGDFKMLLATQGCYLMPRRPSNLCFYINICDAHVNLGLEGVPACVFLRPTVHPMSSSLGSSSYSVLIGGSAV